MRKYGEYQECSRGKKMRTLRSHGTKFRGKKKSTEDARRRAINSSYLGYY